MANKEQKEGGAKEGNNSADDAADKVGDDLKKGLDDVLSPSDLKDTVVSQEDGKRLRTESESTNGGMLEFEGRSDLSPSEVATLKKIVN